MDEVKSEEKQCSKLDFFFDFSPFFLQKNKAISEKRSCFVYIFNLIVLISDLLTERIDERKEVRQKSDDEEQQIRKCFKLLFLFFFLRKKISAKIQPPEKVTDVLLLNSHTLKKYKEWQNGSSDRTTRQSVRYNDKRHSFTFCIYSLRSSFSNYFVEKDSRRRKKNKYKFHKR